MANDFSRSGMAEREGFEPPIPFQVCRFSRPVPSTTRPSLRLLHFYYSFVVIHSFHTVYMWFSSSLACSDAFGKFSTLLYFSTAYKLDILIRYVPTCMVLG